MRSALRFVLAVLIVLGAVNVIALVTEGSIVVEVPTGAVGGVAGAPDHLRSGVAIDHDGTVEVVVSDPDTGQLISKALTIAPTYLIAAIVFALLLGVLRGALRDDPFSAATVRRLRVLAVVALAGGSMAFIVEAIAAMDLSARVTNGYVGAIIDLTPMGMWILAGFGFMAIAEVINRGRTLRAELDAVI